MRPGKGTEHLDQQRQFNRFLFEWCLARAERALNHSDHEGAANWAYLAARFGRAFGCGELVSHRLEAVGLKLAESISNSKETFDTPGAAGRWLHVLSIAHHVGGHTKLVQRWIENDVSAERHDLVVTCMSEFDFPELRRAVASRAGKISLLGSIPSLLERARLLREIAWKRADRVVLHVHPFDVIPLMAFGIAGGPPILLLNHADHLFWVGAAIADQVINLREAGEELCIRSRGVDRSALLPIPLALPPPNCGRDTLRQRLRIPSNAIVFLTVGSEFKYRPVGDLDFVQMARKLLATLPGTHIVAVGPRADVVGWTQLDREFKHRVHAVGEQRELASYHAAADVYLESFPFGSLTALLEAASTGLPFVRLPRTAPPPFSSSRYALSVLGQPADTDAYLTEAVTLARSSEARRRKANAAREAILSFHCGDTWRAKLKALTAAAPRVHSIYTVRSAPLPNGEDRFWAQFLQQEIETHPFLFLDEQAHARGFSLRVDLALVQAAMAGGKGVSKLLPLLWWATGGYPFSVIRRLQRSYMRHVGWRFAASKRVPQVHQSD